MSVMTAVAHNARQAARLAWYGALYAETRRRTARSIRETAFEPTTAPPARGALTRALFRVLRDDRRHVAAGTYLAPEVAVDAARLARAARDYFEELKVIEERRAAESHQEPAAEAAADEKGRYPRYYLQNFHYQSGGWLSERSAKLYDTQVEVLFTGAADAMRRQALPFLAEAYAGRDTRTLKHLDIACGAGAFAREVKRNYPSLDLTALDLSAPYLEEAARRLAPFRRWRTVEANAEAAPFDDAHFDTATCVYLFHELPPKVRPVVAREIARVLKPGGLFVFVDSIQWGDEPDLDRLLEFFPVSFHEPYYAHYCGEDLDALFAGAGLEPAGAASAYLSKVRAYRKPD